MSVTSMNGHDGNTLVGGAGQDLIYGFDPAGPRRRGDRMTRREVLAAIGGIQRAVTNRSGTECLKAAPHCFRSFRHSRRRPDRDCRAILGSTLSPRAAEIRLH
jgi:hypothetical protein